MKVLDLNKSIREFNEDLREGMEQGFVLNKIEDSKVLIELCANLVCYVQYFLAASYGKEKI